MHEDLPVDLHLELPDAGHAPAVDPTPPGSHSPELELDTPGGPRLLDPPTVDSDDDGRPDTAVDVDGAGTLDLATDLDGDHHVDVLTTIDTAGVAHTVVVTPSPGWNAWDEGVPPPAPVLDPVTGRWTPTVE